MEFLATAAPSTEDVLLKELEDLHVRDVRPLRGKVQFSTSMETACKLAFTLRTARRVLMPLKTVQFDTKEDFFEGAKSIHWEDFMDNSRTFAVRAKGEDPVLRNSAYSALLLKDAVCDRFRDKTGKRPDVDKESPDMTIQVLIEKGRASISLDLGGPLHKRGYRRDSAPGSLNETLAAAILKLAGYCGDELLVDPMSGSGTIGIEAALIAANVAPGLLWQRERGFFSMPVISERAKKDIVESARQKVKKPGFEISLSDVSASAVKASLANAKRAGIAGFMKFRQADFFDVAPPPGPGLVATNMPYGDHTGPELEITEFYKRAGDKLKQDFKGFRAALLLGSSSLQKCVGLYAFRKFSLYNGKKEVKLCLYELYEGSRKTRKEPS